MRVALVNRNLAALGGLEVFCRDLITALSEHGVEMHAVTAAAVDLPCPVHRIRAGNLGKLSTMAFVAGAVRACRRIRPDVTNLHEMDGHALAALFAPGRVLISQHGFGHFGLGRLIRRLRPSVKFLANSAWSASILLERAGIASDGFVYPLVRPPAPLDRRACRAEIGVGEDELLVLHVGRCVPPKGQATLLEAARLCAGGPPQARRLRFALVGDGRLRPAMEDFVRANGLGRIVRLPGAIPHAETARWFSAADIYAQPSLFGERVEGISESFGITVAEAMSFGLPLVLSDIGIFRELAGDAGGAAFFPQGNAAALARLLEDLARRPEDRRATGEAAAARYRQRFAPERSWTEYLALYRSLASAAR
jgi:glycosyltransferase involved in cell wall biosynthesis